MAAGMATSPSSVAVLMVVMLGGCSICGYAVKVGLRAARANWRRPGAVVFGDWLTPRPEFCVAMGVGRPGIFSPFPGEWCNVAVSLFPPPMSKEFILETTVRFSEVDRDQVMLLPALFQLLQEAAIRHADMHGVGANSIAERGTSWVLNRLAVALTRYPRRDEVLRVETWSTGVRGFRGYREFRLFCGDELLLSGSSLWLWIDLRTRMLTRVPQELESAFPVGGEGRASHKPELERLRFAAVAESATATPVTVRYSDCDANGHVNNTAYFDYLQTSLVSQGRSAHPLRLELQFVREIPTNAEAVQVRLEARAEALAFAIGGAEGVFAQGEVA